MLKSLFIVALIWLLPTVGQACGSDTPPAAVAALGLTCETFADGPFSFGAIDVSNTATITNQSGSCTSGHCNWYVDPNWPNSAIGAQCPGVLGSCPVTICDTSGSSICTISAGVLTLNRKSAYTAGRVDIGTCKASGTAPGWFGTAFKPPFYMEFSATYGTGLDSATGEATVWSLSQSYLVAGAHATMQGIELDYIEGPYGKDANNINTLGNNSQNEIFQPMANGGQGVSNGTLVVPQNRNPNNDGFVTGLVDVYGAGSEIANNKLTFGTSVVPKFNGGTFGGAATGAYSTLNTDQFCIMFGSGFNQPLTITYLRVWQLAPPGPGGGRALFR